MTNADAGSVVIAVLKSSWHALLITFAIYSEIFLAPYAKGDLYITAQMLWLFCAFGVGFGLLGLCTYVYILWKFLRVVSRGDLVLYAKRTARMFGPVPGDDLMRTPAVNVIGFLAMSVAVAQAAQIAVAFDFAIISVQLMDIRRHVPPGEIARFATTLLVTRFGVLAVSLTVAADLILFWKPANSRWIVALLVSITAAAVIFLFFGICKQSNCTVPMTVHLHFIEGF